MTYWILLILLALLLAILALSYLCYRMTFLVLPKHRTSPYKIPNEYQNSPLHGKMFALIGAAVKLPYEDVYVTSKDGLRLHGRYYETAPGAPVQILFHGYHGHPLRDFCGGLQLALQSGCNAILIDERAHGESEGKCLSFGVLERHDCCQWIDYAAKRFGKETPIILAGVSMGAATVLMASELTLPRNVVGIIADCGYSSPKEIICRVIRQMKYPVKTGYALVRLSGKIFGGFDIEAYSPIEAVKNTDIPILFIHGEADDFVPCEMSRRMFEECAAKKEILTVPRAKHVMSYVVDEEAYREMTQKFLREILHK